MGWISYHASHYKRRTVDRKAECDAYFTEGLNQGHFEILKSRLIGNVYYAAIKYLMRYVGIDSNNKEVYEAIEDGQVWQQYSSQV